MTVDMTRGSVWKQLLRFFFPLLLTSVFQQMYSMVDAVIVGQFIGKAGLAAIDSVGEFARLPVNFAIGLAAGATILISRDFGAGRRDRLADTARSGLRLAFWIGLAFSLVTVAVSGRAVVLLEVPADIQGGALTYLRIYMAGMVFNLLYNMGSGIMRAVGDSRTPMRILLAAGAINVTLDLILVGPFGAGIAGAAFATLIAQAFSAIAALVYLFSRGEDHALSIRRGRASLARTGEIIALGLPTALRSAMWPFANTIIHTAINSLGTEVVAAWAVSKKMDILLWLSIDSMGPSVMTFVAQNHGARDLKRARAGTRAGLIAGLIIMVTFSSVIYLFPAQLGSIFINRSSWDILPLVTRICRWQAPFYFVYTFGCILTNTISGYGDTLGPMLIIMVGTCGFRIFWILCVVPLVPGLHSVVMAYIAAYFVTAALAGLYYFARTLPGLKRRQEAV